MGASSAGPRMTLLLQPPERDLRLDFIRGIGQWIIFLDHIPNNFCNWFTLRNFGFSDAAEFFVYASGYSIGFAYGPAVRNGLLLAAAKRLWTRASQLYVAHIFLFLFFVAQVARTAARFDNPMYKDVFNVAQFLNRPDIMIGQALMLRYKPVNLDVLPLYIVLVLAAPALLWCLLRRPNLTLLASAMVYFVARHLDWNLPSFPGGKWYFNPFAWQFLFVFGIWCGFGSGPRIRSTALSRSVTVVAVALLIFAFLIVMTWHVPSLEGFVPEALSRAIYPIDKTNLDPLRLTHFVATLIVLLHFLPPDAHWLSSKRLRPVILCGQRSLPVFCFGVFLSFAAYWILVQVSDGIVAQILVSVVGIALLVSIAWLATWYRSLPSLFSVAESYVPEQ
ncbi:MULTISPECIES: OpgC domain-containing protein [unclassified Bradyrhizobium]|uniref:OpgC domain-containing protein n=1 Tax=unclassified Bradyrhizobium TaxID=2631580 RepID=UPI0023062B40|nr:MULTISPECIES: OpgC domain-containing protein [unclassified Bradyrhizobium]MDA9410866.1 membrane protein [Bradyrhizobium sp. CCBAU 45384]MDA9442474.1 membrane protein [Bradyrhizobium sp. CCBAU 51745]